MPTKTPQKHPNPKQKSLPFRVSRHTKNLDKQIRIFQKKVLYFLSS